MRILLVDIDTLRPDHLGCYGYHRPTSPNIDKIAEEGVRFTNYYTSNPPCLPNRTAFWTGKFGINTGVINHGGLYADLQPQGPGRGFKSNHYQDALALQIHRAGLKTTTISSFASRHTAYHFLYGFDEVHDPIAESDGDQGDLVNGMAQDWLDNNGANDDWFLHVHLWDPHTPYDHPPEFADEFKDMPVKEWLTEEVIEGMQGKAGWNTAENANGFSNELQDFWSMGKGSVKNLDDAKEIINGYDAGIRYSDYFIGKITDKLKKLGVYDDTIIIITSDHGESFGELNSWGEHAGADQMVAKVPLIIKANGLASKGNEVRDGLHYQLDLAATLVDIVGREQPKSWDGESFKSSLNKNKKGRDYLVMDSGTHICQRSVRWDDYILVRTYHCGTNNYPQYMLFDLDKDPHEQHDLANERQDLVGLGMLKIDNWMGDQMFKAERGDPMWGIIKEGGPLHQASYSNLVINYIEKLKSRPEMKKEYERISTNYGMPAKNGFFK